MLFLLHVAFLSFSFNLYRHCQVNAEITLSVLFDHGLAKLCINGQWLGLLIVEISPEIAYIISDTDSQKCNRKLNVHLLKIRNFFSLQNGKNSFFCRTKVEDVFSRQQKDISNSKFPKVFLSLLLFALSY